MTDPIRDEPADLPQRQQRLAYSGRVWDVRVDDVTLPHGETITRDLVLHHGAVGIIALDDQDRVLLLRQYRHPVGMYLWEPPAGLLDDAAESPLVTAQRELAEEAGLVADRWWVLADWFNSPGGSSEAFRCFLARGLSPLPGGRPPRAGEEYDLPVRWVPLDEAVAAILAGSLQNPATVAGVLSAAVQRAAGWRDLRPADAAWPARDHLRSADRIRPTR
jgi:8-oxo-dGTP pyrophosphatase MutT (NUDIX family)